MPSKPKRKAVPKAVKRRGWAMLTKTGRIDIMKINLDRDYMMHRGFENNREVIPVLVLITPKKGGK